jgi:ADP-ribose pyrophosphatase YjhB (NUDIX family)
VLLHRDGRWLLSVRGPQAAYAPGEIGMIGGHVETVDQGPGVLEAAGRREVREETGIDLGTTPLRYVDSESFTDEEDATQISVTFMAEASAGVEATLAAPDELASVGWWTLEQIASDRRSPDWLPPLVARAASSIL